MNTLHLISSEQGMRDCRRVAAAEDTLVLLQDGVYADTAKVKQNLVVLSEDAEARGVGKRLSTSIARIDYGGLVRLVETHKPIVTWSG